AGGRPTGAEAGDVDRPAGIGDQPDETAGAHVLEEGAPAGVVDDGGVEDRRRVGGAVAAHRRRPAGLIDDGGVAGGGMIADLRGPAVLVEDRRVAGVAVVVENDETSIVVDDGAAGVGRGTEFRETRQAGETSWVEDVGDGGGAGRAVVGETGKAATKIADAGGSSRALLGEERCPGQRGIPHDENVVDGRAAGVALSPEEGLPEILVANVRIAGRAVLLKYRPAKDGEAIVIGDARGAGRAVTGEDRSGVGRVIL